MADKKRKCGPLDHFTGVKFEFLNGHSDAFQLTIDTKKISEFYELVTVQFIKKFGDNMETIRENPENDAPAPEDLEGTTSLTTEAAAKKLENYKRLIKVSDIQQLRQTLLTTSIEIAAMVL